MWMNKLSQKSIMPHRYTPSYSEQRGHSVGYIKLLIIRGRIQASNGNNKCAAVNDISRAKIMDTSYRNGSIVTGVSGFQ